ncbi:Carbohydrate deacetylase [Vibrio stylophorae]|uniref:Carbohydrate deacetylase n=1 Tax=Vibrio stylophorae TaxID=659351 RepID=A0ABM8ZY42_9VIBR|nr:ChbG/HpnK family deacetylase [Vibrio stylophorae]CAH0535769.1 Carbohydrate deacetylase [Vibrio stylophorae]
MNPALQALGYGPEDRVVVFHCDDIGVYQATLPAYEHLLDANIITSASAMVPCPWFEATAQFYQKHPDIDLGIHLTLTSEWPSYPWRPLLPHARSTGLVTERGFMPPQPEPIWHQADMQAVHAEIRAQIHHALASGINPSHFDSHMLAMIGASTLPVMHQLALEHQCAVMAMSPHCMNTSPWARAYYNLSNCEACTPLTERYPDVLDTAIAMQNDGFALFDSFLAMSYTEPNNRVEQAQKLLAELPPGLHFFMLHPAMDTPELRAVCPGVDWQVRVADYQAFIDPRLAKAIRDLGIHSISFQPLQALLMAHQSTLSL